MRVEDDIRADGVGLFLAELRAVLQAAIRERGSVEVSVSLRPATAPLLTRAPVPPARAPRTRPTPRHDAVRPLVG